MAAFLFREPGEGHAAGKAGEIIFFRRELFRRSLTLSGLSTVEMVSNLAEEVGPGMIGRKELADV